MHNENNSINKETLKSIMKNDGAPIPRVCPVSVRCKFLEQPVKCLEGYRFDQISIESCS